MRMDMRAFPTSGSPAPRLARTRFRAWPRLAAPALAAALVASACSLPHLRLPEERPTIPVLPQNSMIFDSSGRLITILHAGENRILVPIEQIPVITRQAVIPPEGGPLLPHTRGDARGATRG